MAWVNPSNNLLIKEDALPRGDLGELLSRMKLAEPQPLVEPRTECHG